MTTTQTVAPKYFPDSCSGSDIFLGGVYGRLEAQLVWFVRKNGVLILVLTEGLSLMVITSNHHMKAAAHHLRWHLCMVGGSGIYVLILSELIF